VPERAFSFCIKISRNIDPACGSGGFIIRSLAYVRNKIEKSARSQAAMGRAESIFRHRLFGIDKTPKLVKVAKANMLLGKDGHTGLIHHDSLSSFDSLPIDFAERAGKEKPTIILANPPFGASSDHKITDINYLNSYLSGNSFTIDENDNLILDNKKVAGVAPEILFLERCIDWVAPGGYVGIVMARGALDNRESALIRKYVLEETKIIAIVNCHDDTFEPYCGSKASFLILQKKTNEEKLSLNNNNYSIFMAISKNIGQTSRGEAIFKRNENGKILIENGSPVLDHDMNEILSSFNDWKAGREISYEFAFSISYNKIEKPYYNLNPVKFMPTLNKSLKKVIELGEQDSWDLRRLGDIAPVFNGPRFKRPYADEGVTSGESIVPYYTGTAFTQTKAENIKYLDWNKANNQQKKQLELLKIHEGWLLVSDSGTLGRVIYARKEHEGVIATNNLIRIPIEDKVLRAYVYQFLMSDLGQHQMLRHAYGTNQLHIEPWHVADVLIPFPQDENEWKIIGENALKSIELLEESRRLEAIVNERMTTLFSL
jgi:type I restriction enzyme M protein